MYSETTRFRKSVLRSAVLLALSINGAALTLSGAAHADNQACANAVTTGTASSNFTMLKVDGYTMGADGGTNDVMMSWDGTAYTSSTDYTGPGGSTNVTMSSSLPDPFFGASWAAHDIQVFAPGTYEFDAGDNTPGAGTGGPAGSNNEAAGTMQNVTVPPGMIGMHMLFDWSGNNNIDVFIVVAQDSVFGAGIARSTQSPTVSANNCDNLNATAPIKNCLFDGSAYFDGKPAGTTAGKPAGNKVWMLASIDGDGDGIMGIPMPTGGPFAGFNANFNFSFSSAPVFTSGTVCAPTAVIAPFTFTDVTAAAINTEYQSNLITVSFSSGGGSVPVSISGGQYSKNGGVYTSADGTAVAGDTFRVKQTTGANEDGTTSNTSLSIGGVSDAFNVTVIDTKPDAFSFTDQTGVAINTPVESNAITVAGLGAGLSTAINISGGTYTIDDGAPTGAAGTVQNGDVIRVQQTSSANEATTTIATLTLGSDSNGTEVTGTFTVSTAGGGALTSTGNNFTMLDKAGGITGGTNDVVMFWDQQFSASTSDPVTPATAHMRLSTGTAFFSFNWVAHHIRVFPQGTYTINVECTVALLEAGSCGTNADPSKNYTLTVGAGQIGAHMLFDWGNNSPSTSCGKESCNIDVVHVWDQVAVFGPSPLHNGAVGFNAATTVWDLMSSDATASCPGVVDNNNIPIICTSNGINGVPMIDGPFKGSSANFNINFTGTQAPTNYTPTVAVDDPSGAKGCSISSTQQVSALERADWWLVAGFLAWLGALRMRFKRQAQS
jgi:hypothetical protein